MDKVFSFVPSHLGCLQPLDLHKGRQGTRPSCESQRYPSEGVPQQLACPSLLLHGLFRQGSPGSTPVPWLEFHFQQGEIYSQALVMVWVPGSGLQHHALVGLSSFSRCITPAVSPVFLTSGGQSNGRGVGIALGPDVLCTTGSTGASSQVSTTL